MKIQRDKFYLYIGYTKSETKWTWDFELSKPSYLWLLADIGVLHRCLSISVRVGKCQIVRKQGQGDVSSDNSPRYSHKPVTFDGDAWLDWEL